MNYRCYLSAVPLRKEPISSSEQVSELLFGETCTLLSEQCDWIEIKCDHDGYEGFVSKERLTIDSSEGPNFTMRNWDHFAIAKSESNTIRIPFGAIVPESGSFSFEGEQYQIQARKNTPSLSAAATSYLNVPYRWGGRSSFGIDCSGLVQQLMLLSNTQLPRDAYQQAELGKEVDFNERQEGDLAFFPNKSGKISHVGILSSKNTIIHAAGFVREDVFDENGIYRQSENRYSHKLAFIRHYD